MSAHFGLEAHSDPMDHDDGSDDFIIEQYRSQIDQSPPPPKIFFSKDAEWALKDQLEALRKLRNGYFHLGPQLIDRNLEAPERVMGEKPAESDNSEKRGDTGPMNDINREELDAKLSAVEARMDRRIADFQGDMRQAVSDFRLEIQPIKGVKANIWSATAVMVGSIVAVVGVSFTAFDSGRETSALVQEAKQQTVETRKLLEQIQAQQKSLATPAPAPSVAPTTPK